MSQIFINIGNNKFSAHELRRREIRRYRLDVNDPKDLSDHMLH